MKQMHGCLEVFSLKKEIRNATEEEQINNFENEGNNPKKERNE
jgi:hypothetical protein